MLSLLTNFKARDNVESITQNLHIFALRARKVELKQETSFTHLRHSWQKLQAAKYLRRICTEFVIAEGV